ncbi:unnamed protein product [Schistosoma mattheei]|uniref:Uncharacterized protein n=1 Tax=Schistosoma mattheei TaxID=31246 RepID=A0A183PSF9_9TREM|nr:unnamed protein product [Schistosoma mattheei]
MFKLRLPQNLDMKSSTVTDCTFVSSIFRIFLKTFPISFFETRDTAHTSEKDRKI